MVRSGRPRSWVSTTPMSWKAWSV